MSRRKIFEGVHTYKFDVEKFNKDYSAKDSQLKRDIDMILHEVTRELGGKASGDVTARDDAIEFRVHEPKHPYGDQGAYTILAVAEVDNYNGDVFVTQSIENAQPPNPQTEIPEDADFHVGDIVAVVKPYVSKTTRPTRAERRAAAAAGAPQEGKARKTKRSSRKTRKRKTRRN